MMDSIFADALPLLLDRFPDARILSLDCFDTLLWRDTHAPHDVFAALDLADPFQRSLGEQRARSTAALLHQRNEVTLAEIYAEILPNADAGVRAAMVAAELATEMRMCFGFAPVIALIRAAKARGLPVVVASDTYFDAEQLGALIAAAAGSDVRAMIDRIYCSCDHKRSKGEGLLGIAAADIGLPASAFLHVGDNPKADYDAAHRLGMQAVHLRQFTPETEQRLRLEAGTDAMLHPNHARIAPIQPHRATLALGERQIACPAERLGYGVIGPVLDAFATWLRGEVATLRAGRGGIVHLLFLMRDGYLPKQVYEARIPDASSHAIEISRFTATAASFATAEDVLRYCALEATTEPGILLNQLLLPRQEAVALLRSLPPGGGFHALIRAIRQERVMRRILERSRKFADRLADYLRQQVAPAPGDTLVLVDLGYNGTVQNMIAPVLRRMFDVATAGRYLLLREQDVSGLDKRGFIAAPDYDGSTLEALCGNVAVLEQICTVAQGSVVDYARGAAVRGASAIKGAQSATRDAVQSGALRYAGDVGGVIVRGTVTEDAAAARRAAAAVMGRLMFLPQPEELAVLEQFQHDVNLGANDTVPLFDREIGAQGLRRRGLFYLRGAERMYLPAELQGAGLSVKIALFAHKRFGLPLTHADFGDSTLALPILIADGVTVDMTTVAATPTHDGYHTAVIPIGDCRFAVGVQFGQICEWLQIDSVRFVPVDRYVSAQQRFGLDECDALPSLEGMEQVAPHLFRCPDASATLLIPPPPRQDARPMLVTVVFRPLVLRATEGDGDAAPHAAAEEPVLARA